MPRLSYQAERDRFLVRMTEEGLPYPVAVALLRAATTLQRYAELLCSSEYACNVDVTMCPGAKREAECLCDKYQGQHERIPRTRIREHRLEARMEALVAAVDGGAWRLDHQGDPRGYALMQPAQGRYTYATPDEAQAWIDAVYDPAGPTNPDVRTSVWGTDPRCEVRPCECWAGHHDPVGIYFGDAVID